MDIVIDDDAQAIHAVQKGQGEQQPVEEPPEGIGVAGCDELEGCAGDIGGDMYEKQVDDDKENEGDSRYRVEE